MRIYSDGIGHLFLKEGDYGKDIDGLWYCRPPGTPVSCLGCLKNHQVVEHNDGTITVSLSILIRYYDENKNAMSSWHGFLEKGIWREV